MTILITGANSLLGQALNMHAPREHKLCLSDIKKINIENSQLNSLILDVTDKRLLKKIVKEISPQIIIHLAALSSVDYCQKHKNDAFKVNVNGTHNILNVASKYDIKVIYTSTNSVFDGKKGSYTERQKPNPIHTYGKTKLRSEKLIKGSNTPHIIARLITMYGWPPTGARQNPVTWAVQKLKKKEALNMVEDNFVNPLYANSAAIAIWKLIQKKSTGTFHIAGKSKVNRYQWMLKTARIFGYKTDNIKPVPSSFFPNITTRPADATLATGKIQKTIKWKPLTLKQGLTNMHKRNSS